MADLSVLSDLRCCGEIGYRSGEWPLAWRIACAAASRFRWLRRNVDRLAVETPMAPAASESFPSAASNTSSTNAAAGQNSLFPVAMARRALACWFFAFLPGLWKHAAISSRISSCDRSCGVRHAHAMCMRRFFNARDLFWLWLRVCCPCAETWDGSWTNRTAVSTLFFRCPPGPEDLYVSTLQSFRRSLRSHRSHLSR